MRGRYHDKPDFSSRDGNHRAYKSFVENLYEEQYEYFFKISYDIIRARKECLLDTDALDATLVSDSDVFLTVAEKLELEDLTQLLTELSSVEFWLIQQRYMEEKSFREIGEILGIREEAARKRHQRILAKLRGLSEQQLEEKGGRTYGQK